jgi:hypothetical protein
MPEIKSPSQTEGIPKDRLFFGNDAIPNITERAENDKPFEALTWKDYETDLITRYVNGGMEMETAVNLARGEIGAILTGNHYSRDAAGKMRPTPADL